MSRYSSLADNDKQIKTRTQENKEASPQKQGLFFASKDGVEDAQNAIKKQ